MKFSIVTPSWNSERYISETIESVITQRGDFSIEYIVMDNCSSDRTLGIVCDYREAVASGRLKAHCHDVEIKLFSSPDFGMYDAIDRGFSHASGDVYAWINSDDIYLPGAFSAIAKSLQAYPDIDWIKGVTSYIDDSSVIYSVGECNIYVREWIKAGIYGPILFFIQQDSVFWRSRMWDVVKGKVRHYRLAGDYIVWRRFAEKSPLVSLNVNVSCFRCRQGQKSEDLTGYWEEGLSRYPIDRSLSTVLNICQWLDGHIGGRVGEVVRRLMYHGKKSYLVTMDNGDPRLFIDRPDRLMRYCN